MPKLKTKKDLQAALKRPPLWFKDQTPFTKDDAAQWKREVRAAYAKQTQKGAVTIGGCVAILCIFIGAVIGSNLLRLASKGYDQERRQRVSDMHHRPDFRNHDTSSAGYSPESQSFTGCTVCGDQNGACDCGGYSVQ